MYSIVCSPSRRMQNTRSTSKSWRSACETSSSATRTRRPPSKCASRRLHLELLHNLSIAATAVVSFRACRQRFCVGRQIVRRGICRRARTAVACYRVLAGASASAASAVAAGDSTTRWCRARARSTRSPPRRTRRRRRLARSPPAGRCSSPGRPPSNERALFASVRHPASRRIHLSTMTPLMTFCTGQLSSIQYILFNSIHKLLSTVFYVIITYKVIFIDHQ